LAASEATDWTTVPAVIGVSSFAQCDGGENDDAGGQVLEKRVGVEDVEPVVDEGQ
jgi:hypothetical protein